MAHAHDMIGAQVRQEIPALCCKTGDRKMARKTQGYKTRTKLAKLFPNYAMDVDNEGGIIIYTNMKETANDTYKEMSQ